MSAGRHIVILDTETTSLSPFAGIWEFAAVRRDLVSGYREQLQFFISGLDLTHADPKALEVGGYYDRHPDAHRWQPATSPAGGVPKPGPKGGKVFTSLLAAQTIARVCQGATVVGSNPSFDTERLARLLRRHGIAPTWAYRTQDVHSLMVGHLGVDLMWESTDDLAARLHVEPASDADRHTALGDTLWCERIWDRLAELDSDAFGNLMSDRPGGGQRA